MRLLFIILLVGAFALNGIAQTVYVTPHGTRYHTGDCRMVENVSTKIELSNAINKGYIPCKYASRQSFLPLNIFQLILQEE